MMLTSGSLCTGYGGLSMAVADALGTHMRWLGEHEPPNAKTPAPTQAAARILAHRFPDVPNLGDMRTVDWARVDEVDVVEAGYPCPGESVAGKRLGTDDARWMWPAYFRLIREMRPRLAIGENVRGHLTKSFRYVLADLQAIGYSVVWDIVAASDVGVCHQRERLIWLAYEEQAGPPSGMTRHALARLIDDDWRNLSLLGPAMVDDLPAAGAAYGGSLHHRSPWTGGIRRTEPLLPTPTTQDAANNGGPSQMVRNSLPLNAIAPLLPRATWAPDVPKASVNLFSYARPVVGDVRRFGIYAAAVARQEEFSRPAPDPAVPDGKGGTWLNPYFGEWMMDAPEGWICDVPGITRNEALRAASNGVVRRQGAVAVRHLMQFVPAAVLGERAA